MAEQNASQDDPSGFWGDLKLDEWEDPFKQICSDQNQNDGK